MKLSCLQENLSRGLGTVGRAVSARTTMPIIQNVLLSSDQGMLKLTATNLELSISTWIGAMIEEEGSIAVPHHLLHSLVNELPSDRVDMDLRGLNDEDGDPTTGGSVLHLACGRSVNRINGASARDFPHIPTAFEGAMLDISPGTLRSAIRMTAFTAAKDTSRPVLNGLEMRIENEILKMAAADGFRLSAYTGAIAKASPEDVNVIVPAATMRELQRLLSDQKDDIQVTLSPEKNQIMFKLDQIVVVSQLIQGAFPNYEQLVPDNASTFAVVKASQLKRAADIATVFARDGGNNIVRLEMQPADDEVAADRMVVWARSDEMGHCRDEIDLESLTGEATRIAFNVQYMRDVLAVLNDGDVVIELTTNSAPGAFRLNEDRDRYVHVVMPMYVQW